MSPGTKINIGQILIVLLTVLGFVWTATQWTAYHLADQPQLGAVWFTLAGWHVYPPYAFFWWWFSFDAYPSDPAYTMWMYPSSSSKRPLSPKK